MTYDDKDQLRSFKPVAKVRHFSDEHPWDPSEVKIDSRVVTVDSLYRRLEANEIDLHPAFQRNQDLWQNKEKSWFIESLLLGIPIPTFYFDTTIDSRWVVIDGLQRLTTLKQFFFEGLRLTELQYLKAYENITYHDLPRSLVRRILETQFNINAVLPGAPERVVFDIFRRINTGGITLNSQEIRNALNQGNATFLISDLSDILIYSGILGRNYKNDRQQVGELINRFIAFRIFDYDAYVFDDMDYFLNESLVDINEGIIPLSLSEIRAGFDQAVSLSSAVFGENAFRKVNLKNGRKSQVNKALFEVITVEFSLLNNAQINTIVNNRDSFIKGFYEFIESDREMNIAISHGTQEGRRVRARFASMRRFIQEFVDDHGT